MTREEILTAAKQCVCGEREEDYGTPEDSFGLIGNLWSTYLGVEISAKDVAVLMALLKIARIKTDTKSDSYVDLAGYAACAGEIADKGKEEKTKPVCEAAAKLAAGAKAMGSSLADVVSYHNPEAKVSATGQPSGCPEHYIDNTMTDDLYCNTHSCAECWSRKWLPSQHILRPDSVVEREEGAAP